MTDQVEDVAPDVRPDQQEGEGAAGAGGGESQPTNRVAMWICLLLALALGVSGLVAAGIRGGLSMPLLPDAVRIVVHTSAKTLPLSCLGVALSIIAACAAVGYSNAANPFSLLINERNRFSLSRYQMLVWSIVIIPAFIVATTYKSACLMLLGKANSLSSASLGPELWVLLGGALGTYGLANSFLQPRAPETMVRNSDSTAARFSDFFRAEGVEREGNVDLSRVQHFLVTTVMAIIFSNQLMAWLSLAADRVATAAAGESAALLEKLTLPTLDQTLLGIIAASHATYLSNKPGKPT